MDFRDRIELQLLRVSRGAHELTQLIDSWSKSPNVNGQPKHLVNGLLRGSMDLQESLLMLSRLQEAERRTSMTPKRRQQDGGDDCFEITRSRSFHKDCYSSGLQGTRCFACEPSSSCVELKQVERDRLVRQNSLQLSSDECRSPPSKHWVLSGTRENFSAQAKKKGPNLVAKLMGLEELPNGVMGLDSKRRQLKQKTLDEIIETLRTNGVLKTKQSVSLRDKSKAIGEIAGNHTNGGIPPIVIIKPQHSPCWKKEEDNVSSHGCTLQKTMEETGAKSFEKEKNEAAQKGKTAVATSQKHLNKAVTIREGKRAEDIKKQVVHGKKQMERKTGKTIAEPIKINSTAKITPEKRQPTTRKGSLNKSIGKDGSPLKLASFNSTSSAKGEKSSTEKRIKQPTASAKNADPKAKDRKQITYKSGTHGLQKQAEKESPKTSKKDGTMKTQKLICEVMPKSNRAKRLLRAIAESLKKSHGKQTPKAAPEVKYHLRHLLLSSHSFRNLAYELFGISLPKPPFFRSGFFDEHELGTDRLLLDCTEELARRKSHEGKSSIYQMVRERSANRSAYSSFGHLVEEMSEWIKKLARYGQAEDGGVGEHGIDVIFEKDLLGRDVVLNAVWGGGWDRRICGEEAEEAVVNAEEQIFSGLVFEVAKDLFLMKKQWVLRV